MREVDHRRIARIIARELRGTSAYLTAAMAKALDDASVAPDSFRERRVHHRGREEDVRRAILEARRWFLGNEHVESARRLGTALHYIADMSCQHEWEDAISKLSEPRDFEHACIKTPYELTDFMRGRLKAEGPSYSLGNAAETGYAIAELTWRPLDSLHAEELEIIASLPRLRRHSYIGTAGLTISFFSAVLGIFGGLIWRPLFSSLAISATGLLLAYVWRNEKDWRLAYFWYGLDDPVFGQMFARSRSSRIVELNRERHSR